MISNENSNSNNLDKTSEIGSLNELFKEINKTLNDESLNNNILNNSEKKSKDSSKILNNTEKKSNFFDIFKSKETSKEKPSIKENKNDKETSFLSLFMPNLQSSNLKSQVKDSVKDSVKDTVKDSVKDSVKSPVKDESEKIKSIDNINFSKNETVNPASSNINTGVYTKIKDNAFKVLSFYNFWYFFKFLIIIVIIATLGFNIFIYLAEGTDYLQYIINKYGNILPKSFVNILKMSAIGIKGTAEKTEIGLNNLEDNIKKNKAKYNKKLWNKKDKNLEKSLDKSTNKNIIKKEKVVIKNKNKYEKKEKAEKAEEYKISIPKPFNRNLQTKKDGWCYIGKDKTGIQCAKVKDIYKCMSGNIYPTREMCINPLLRK